MPTFKHPCPACGKLIARDVARCPFCGAIDPFVPGRCAACRAPIEDLAWVACPKCGAPLKEGVAPMPGATAVTPETGPASTVEPGTGAVPVLPAPAAPSPAPAPAAPTSLSASPVAPPPPAAAACSSCGTALATGARFCTVCGTVAG